MGCPIYSLHNSHAIVQVFHAPTFASIGISIGGAAVTPLRFVSIFLFAEDIAFVERKIQAVVLILVWGDILFLRRSILGHEPHYHYGRSYHNNPDQKRLRNAAPLLVLLLGLVRFRSAFYTNIPCV